MKCESCGIGKAKRICPALDKTICTGCCATGRETTVSCPLDCEYLYAAHCFESRQVDKDALPNSDVTVDRKFLKENEHTVSIICYSFIHSLRQQLNVDDADLRSLLVLLIEATKPNTSVGIHREFQVCDKAASLIATRIQGHIENACRQISGSGGKPPSQDDFLRAMIFLQRTAFVMDNKRPKCRAFYGYLLRVCPEEKKEDRPLVVLA